MAKKRVLDSCCTVINILSLVDNTFDELFALKSFLDVFESLAVKQTVGLHELVHLMELP